MFNSLKRIANKITMYFGLIDDIFIDFLTDLKSLRYQLLLWAWIFNGFVLYAIMFKSLDWKAMTASLGMLTIVYGFYFQSKQKQAEIENGQITSAGESDPPNADRDPDHI